MIVIIAGSRDIEDIEAVINAVESSGYQITEVVSGTACGVDRLGEQYAKNNGIPVHKFPADWKKYGKGAGYVRNTDMGNYADALIACWDGKSKGTNHMINIMNKLGKKVFVYKINKWGR